MNSITAQVPPIDHPYKYFMLDMDSGAAYGVIFETETNITVEKIVVHRPANRRFPSRFRTVCRQGYRKEDIKQRNFEPTLDYEEAYNHLTK